MSGKKSWFRWYRDTVTDAKFRFVRLRAADLAWPDRACKEELVVSIADVVAAWALILESVTDDNGSVTLPAQFSLPTYISTALDSDPKHAIGIVQAMTEYGLMAKSGDVYRVQNWQRRQYLDVTNSDRQARYRRNEKRNVSVTARNGERNGKITHRQSTETETETEKKKKKINGASAPRETPKIELCKVLDEPHATAVMEHRQRMKKPLTVHAARLLAAKFAQCPDANAAADTMIARGWQGFEVAWMENSRGQGPPQSIPGQEPWRKALRDAEQKRDADKDREIH